MFKKTGSQAVADALIGFTTAANKLKEAVTKLTAEIKSHDETVEVAKESHKEFLRLMENERYALVKDYSKAEKAIHQIEAIIGE